jgi:hypothetical protein
LRKVNAKTRKTYMDHMTSVIRTAMGTSDELRSKQIGGTKYIRVLTRPSHQHCASDIVDVPLIRTSKGKFTADGSEVVPS